MTGGDSAIASSLLLGFAAVIVLLGLAVALYYAQSAFGWVGGVVTEHTRLSWPLLFVAGMVFAVLSAAAFWTAGRKLALVLGALSITITWMADHGRATLSGIR